MFSSAGRAIIPRGTFTCTAMVKWDLDNERPMKGRASRRVIELIEQLREERLL